MANRNLSSKASGRAYGESLFSALYLAFAYIASFVLLFSSRRSDAILLLGIATLILALGDSFHLVPRIGISLKTQSLSLLFWSNIGLIVSSITMTLYYLVMYYVFHHLVILRSMNIYLTVFMWLLVGVRIILILMPQNGWFTGGSLQWAIVRNAPFLVIGIIVASLYLSAGKAYDGRVVWMGVMVVFSFAFYLPVALFAKIKPILGVLMIPKTLCYIAIVSLSLSLL